MFVCLLYYMPTCRPSCYIFIFLSQKIALSREGYTWHEVMLLEGHLSADTTIWNDCFSWLVLHYGYKKVINVMVYGLCYVWPIKWIWTYPDTQLVIMIQRHLNWTIWYERKSWILEDIAIAIWSHNISGNDTFCIQIFRFTFFAVCSKQNKV